MLLALGLAGQGVRWWVGRPGEAPGQVELLSALPPRSPLAHRDSVLALARPLEPGERIDVDKASAAEVARLPRVGLALAKTIVAEREAKGPFGSLEGLDRVPGIGPGLLAAVTAHVKFSGSAGPSFAPVSGQFARPAPPPPGGSTGPVAGGSSQSVNVNTASVSELDGLPGIGPARAAAILQEREARGSFASVEELSRVPGLGPAAIARLRDRVVVR
ncbi:MAG TPA: helix-hairpin-helix domain-containing protein [Gemmatimonadales bacterium]|jgi:competence protein ComEA